MDSKRVIALYLNLWDHYERECFRGVERYASRNGPWEFHTPRGALGHPLPDLRTWRGDGVLGFLRTKELGDQIRSAGLPAVNISQLDPGPGVPRVARDVAATGAQAARYFLYRGFTNHAYYALMNVDTEIERVSEQGFVEAVRKEGHFCSSLTELRPRDPRQSAEHEQKVAAWLKSLPKPVSVFANCDESAAWLLANCRAIGIVVPDDLALMGRGNDELVCKFTKPSLTSITEDLEEIGYRAAALLHELMEGKLPPAEVILLKPGDIIERESTNTTAVCEGHVRTALAYIAEHGCDPITVADVVGQLPIQRTRFEVLFRQALHRSPHTEIIRVRIDRAKKLLAEEAVSVAQIAAKCGFASYSSLSIAFKREVGMSPRAYRKRYSRRQPPVTSRRQPAW